MPNLDINMTDIDHQTAMLVLSAKSIGYLVEYVSVGGLSTPEHQVPVFREGPTCCGLQVEWNPLTRNTDAFVLQVYHGFDVTIDHAKQYVAVFNGHEYFYESFGDSINLTACPYAMTRLVITRAAADIAVRKGY